MNKKKIKDIDFIVSTIYLVWSTFLAVYTLLTSKTFKDYNIKKANKNIKQIDAKLQSLDDDISQDDSDIIEKKIKQIEKRITFVKWLNEIS